MQQEHASLMFAKSKLLIIKLLRDKLQFVQIQLVFVQQDIQSILFQLKVREDTGNAQRLSSLPRVLVVYASHYLLTSCFWQPRQIQVLRHTMLKIVNYFKHLVLQLEHTPLVELLCVSDYISTQAQRQSPSTISLAYFLQERVAGPLRDTVR